MGTGVTSGLQAGEGRDHRRLPAPHLGNSPAGGSPARMEGARCKQGCGGPVWVWEVTGGGAGKVSQAGLEPGCRTPARNFSPQKLRPGQGACRPKGWGESREGLRAGGKSPSWAGAVADRSFSQHLSGGAQMRFAPLLSCLSFFSWVVCVLTPQTCA